ncbi:MAG: sugar phosphate isomerase/epimerase [Candidatus Syntrophonatronum acetioxidans]|uniref:Sugar phosphate isomerase/epimerase n=1 Tax=Candidatus Syntrophonatronum acetioxidans TaxID=1795816 RepID=A0A424Y9J2_9FIRM|nr:MAG: sugar phosphate isomerase/epimerase [Candidatus Syntrophonatronum acetioxidans]
MKLGFPNHPRKDIINEIRWIGEKGFDFAEIFVEPDNDKIFTPDLIRDLNSLLEEFNLDRLGHTACYIPLGSPFKELRDTSVEILKKQLDIFARIGCPKVTLHANWPPGLFSDQEGIELQTETLQRIIPLAGEYNIKLLWECLNSERDVMGNIQRILELNPELEFLADLGHLNVCGRDPLFYLEHFKDKIGHIHLHDNDGNRDLHLPVEAGIISWPELVEKLKEFYDGTITLEIFSREKEYVLVSREKILQEWYGG